MLKHKTFKFRIYPNKEQQVLISKTIGCSRFVFNYLLNAWQNLYETTGSGLSYPKCSAILTGLKMQEDTIWMNEVDSIALQTSVRHLADGLTDSTKSRTVSLILRARRILYNPTKRSL